MGYASADPVEHGNQKTIDFFVWDEFCNFSLHCKCKWIGLRIMDTIELDVVYHVHIGGYQSDHSWAREKFKTKKYIPRGWDVPQRATHYPMCRTYHTIDYEVH